jgi:DNA-binding NarL/FixJ family response regulator
LRPRDAAWDGKPQPPTEALEATGLTARETDVLRLLAAGMRDREIADALFISHGTARKHVNNVLAKLDLHTRAAATAYAHRLGIV